MTLCSIRSSSGLTSDQRLCAFLLHSHHHLFYFLFGIQCAPAVACIWTSRYFYAQPPFGLALTSLAESRVYGVTACNKFLVNENTGIGFIVENMSVGELVRTI